jgi:hypothetical protein
LLLWEARAADAMGIFDDDSKIKVASLPIKALGGINIQTKH